VKQPINRKQNSSSSQKTTIVIVVSLLGVGVIALVILLVFLLRGRAGLQPAQAVETLPATAVIPTLFVPTPDCGLPTFVIGTTTFQIQNITPAPDGSLAVPSDTSGIAYLVERTDSNYVFVLSPTPDNLSLLSALNAGSSAKATWTNCNSTTYNLFAPETVPASISGLLDQSASGVTIFTQSDPATASFVIRGELTEEQISTINTPASGGSDIQAEISLIETITSPDGATIRVGISIQNYGAAPFTLSTTDVTLTAQDGASLGMINSEPPLPKEIGVGLTETFYFTFPRPTSPIAVIKIFEIEYELEGY